MSQEPTVNPETTRQVLEDVLWREYDFEGRVYRIENPVAFWSRPGGATHRVEDSVGVVHIVPAPGVKGCVLRYAKREGAVKVKF